MRVFITAHPVYQRRARSDGPRPCAAARGPRPQYAYHRIQVTTSVAAAATALGRWPGGPPSASGGCGGAGPLPPVLSWRGRAAARWRCGWTARTTTPTAYRGRASDRVRGCPGTRDSNGKEELAMIPRYQRLHASGFAERKDTLAEGPTEPLTRVPYTCWVCGEKEIGYAQSFAHWLGLLLLRLRSRWHVNGDAATS